MSASPERVLANTRRAASPITSTAPKYERGKQNLEKLTGKPETGPKTGANAFSPESDVFLKEHLFADIFERDVLTFQERELATVAALVSLGGVEPMLQFHLGAGLHVGLAETQLRQLIGLCEAAVGQLQAEAARAAGHEGRLAFQVEQLQNAACHVVLGFL